MPNYSSPEDVVADWGTIAPVHRTQERLEEMLAEWRAQEDLRKHWGAFCDADPFEGSDGFAERMEAAGYAHLRAVTKDDLQESFASERGIERGGNLWELTTKGHAAMDGA